LQRLIILFFLLASHPAIADNQKLEFRNGWPVYQNRVVTGLGQINGIWRRRMPNITRNQPGAFGPNRTEDLNQLTDLMLEFGFPALEHSFGLWYDRRRNDHRKHCRDNGNTKRPFHEQPWARSTEGMACDGLPKYDLTRFNDWYFQRIREFAKLSDQKGTLFYHNYYNQHTLLEQQPHYVDFPWRPMNTIQETGMPDQFPAAEAFYNPQHPERRRLHKLYIRKVLDEIGGFSNVIHSVSLEYTGDIEFVRFWMDTIIEWESEVEGRDVKLAISAPREVLDGILEDPERSKHIDVIDLRFFWYLRDGTLRTIGAGRNVAGRMFDGDLLVMGSTPHRVYEQTLEYRLKYPEKAIFHAASAGLDWYLAFLMAGGSITFTSIHYNINGVRIPGSYHMPHTVTPLFRTNRFLREYVSSALVEMVPQQRTRADGGLYDLSGKEAAIIYTTTGDPFEFDMTGMEGQFHGLWFNPNSNSNYPQKLEHPVSGGEKITLEPPTQNEWLLFLEKTGD
jgi:hypothetical protein